MQPVAHSDPFLDQQIFDNISQGNYTKTIFKNGHESQLDELVVKDQYAATCSFNSVKLWDLETKECLWTHDNNIRDSFLTNIAIAENDVVSTCSVNLYERTGNCWCTDVLQIINRSNG
ncbi:MAG: hypothetical protein JSR46_08475, partial [Verrucomicrobia bacterium]|nr:hypothetical protein [Verrucomicrobiota bacterium]